MEAGRPHLESAIEAAGTAPAGLVAGDERFLITDDDPMSTSDDWGRTCREAVRSAS